MSALLTLVRHCITTRLVGSSPSFVVNVLHPYHVLSLSLFSFLKRLQVEATGSKHGSAWTWGLYKGAWAAAAIAALRLHGLHSRMQLHSGGGRTLCVAARWGGFDARAWAAQHLLLRECI